MFLSLFLRMNLLHIWLHSPPFLFSFFLFPLSVSAKVQFDEELLELIQHTILNNISSQMYLM